MEWYIGLLVLIGPLLILMASGLPVAFCFMILNVSIAFIWWGGEIGIGQVIYSFVSSISTFSLLPVPLFILMGEILFHSNIAPVAIETLDKFLGRITARLSLLAVVGGTLFSTLTGTSIASTALLGATLVPEMEKRGYKKPMSLGPILGSGGLAIMIPPSSLAVLLGAIGTISIGKILMGIIVPGLLMAIIYISYIVVRCTLQPRLAPKYNVPSVPWAEKISSFCRYIMPAGLIIFLVIGVIFLGIATPSEAAATGAIGSFILAAIYGKLNWKVIKKSFVSSVDITVMMLMIIVGATAFSQNLAFCGASSGLSNFTVNLTLHPMLIIWSIQIVIWFLGMFMSPVPIMLITLPLFVPIVTDLGFDPVWFAVIYLLNIEMATTSPPFGLGLFVMKSVSPPDTTMGDCYKAALPFLGCDLIVMILMVYLPSIVLWLPSIMI